MPAFVGAADGGELLVEIAEIGGNWEMGNWKLGSESFSASAAVCRRIPRKTGAVPTQFYSDPNFSQFLYSEQVVLGGALQPAEIAAQHRLKLVLELPRADSASLVCRHAYLRPW